MGVDWQPIGIGRFFVALRDALQTLPSGDVDWPADFQEVCMARAMSQVRLRRPDFAA